MSTVSQRTNAMYVMMHQMDEIAILSSWNKTQPRVFRNSLKNKKLRCTDKVDTQ